MIWLLAILAGLLTALALQWVDRRYGAEAGFPLGKRFRKRR